MQTITNNYNSVIDNFLEFLFIIIIIIYFILSVSQLVHNLVQIHPFLAAYFLKFFQPSCGFMTRAPSLYKILHYYTQFRILSFKTQEFTRRRKKIDSNNKIT